MRLLTCENRFHNENIEEYFFLSKVQKLQNRLEILAFGARDGYLNISESAVGHIFIGLFLRDFFSFFCMSYTLSNSVSKTCSERET